MRSRREQGQRNSSRRRTERAEGRRAKAFKLKPAINRSLLLFFSSSSLFSHLVRDGLVGLDLLGLLGGVSVLARDEKEQRDEADAREGAGEASHFLFFF